MANKENGLLVYPDPITNLDMLSGASFLYFRRPLNLTLPPQVITKESFNFISYVKKRHPYWEIPFFQLLNAWQGQQIAHQNVLKSLEPIRENYINSIWTVYPARTEDLEKTMALISSKGLSFETIFNYIEPFNASAELVRHLLLEVFLSVDKDISKLYQYCEDVFFKQPVDRLLVKGYLLRLLFFDQIDKSMPILLTNEPIWNLLFSHRNNSRVTEQSQDNIQEQDNLEELEIDIISWEIFRQIISPILDPLDSTKIKFISKLMNTRQEQVTRLHNKCLILAEKVAKPKTLNELFRNVEKLVRSELQEEISSLLEIDKKEAEEVFVSLFSDEKTWVGLFTFIVGLASGQVPITTAGAITALGLFNSKTFKAAVNRREKIKKSSFGLVYTISRKTNLKY